VRDSLNTIDPCVGLHKKKNLAGDAIQIWQFLRWFLPWRVEQCLLTFLSRLELNVTASILVPEIIDPQCR
jgi:hypothetical protein